MHNQKNRKQNEKEFLSVIPEAMPDLDDQQSIPLRETAFLTLRKLILTGKLDSTNSAQVGELFLKTADRFTDITLNMSGLKYISSAGIRSLRNLYMKVRGNGGEMSIINASPYVEEVLEMVGYAEMFNLK